MKGTSFLTWLLAIICICTENVCGYTLRILHTNNVNGRIQEIDKYGNLCKPKDEGKCYGGQARLKSKIDEFRAKYPDILLLDGGNQFHGTTFFYVYGGQIMSHFMNLLGYDAMGVGFSEFHTGILGLSKFLNNVTFPVLSCNMDTSKEPGLESIRKSVVLDVAGKKIGIIGFTNTLTPVLSTPGKVTFEDEVSAIKRELAKLTSMGVNIIIGLGSSGFLKNVKIAKQIDEFDVVVGGGSSTFIYAGDAPDIEKPADRYPFVMKTADNNYKLYVHDYRYGKYLGFLEIEFDLNGRPRSWQGNPILLDNTVPKDPKITKIVQAYLPGIEKVKKEKVGRSLVYLQGEKSLCRIKECSAGNMVTDAMVRQNLKYSETGGWNHVAIAFATAGGIRASINKGDVLTENVLAVVPFRNTIDTVELRGSVIWDMLEHSAAGWVTEGRLFGGFMQMSGMQVLYNIRREAGKRVVKAEALCADCDIPKFEPLNMTKTYKILLSSFQLNGGDGYAMIPNNTGSTRVIGQLDSRLLTDYIKENSPLSNILEGRIQFLENDDDNFCPDASSTVKPLILCLTTSLIAAKICFMR